ncbi:DUF3800 domain-containing protein [Candidatus Woesearchaeota archaeon]|nr:DUF3800 domain-containing protein [Candidatus Woesearchaeota archaeon]
MKFAFIDESGDPCGSGSDYFVIGTLWTTRPEDLDRIVKNLRRYKFKKELKKISELKANQSSDEVRIGVLRKIAENEHITCQAIVLKKELMYSEYLNSHSHKLYNYVCGALASEWVLDDKEVSIRIDYSKGKQALRNDFDHYIKGNIEQKRWNCSVTVQHSYSHNWSGLQLADFVSWAVFRAKQYKDDRFFRIIEHKTTVFPVWKKR